MQALALPLFSEPAFFPFVPTRVTISRPFAAAMERRLTTLVLSLECTFRETLKDAGRTSVRPAHFTSQDVFMAAPQFSAEANAVHPPASAQRHRFHLLDALRGLAAMLVVLYHSPMELQTRFHFANSYLAVDFFFCLSGFVVAYSYLRGLRGEVRLRDFAAVRLIRLYPLFAVSMLIAILRVLVSPLKLNDVSSGLDLGLLIASSLLMIPNLLVSGLGGELFPLNAPAWSLLLEIVANLTFAAAVRSSRGRVLLPVLYGIWVTGLLIALGRGIPFDMGAEWRGSAVGLARVGLSFLAGAGLLELYRRFKSAPVTGYGALAGIGVLTLFLGLLTLPAHLTGSTFYPLAAALLLFPALVFAGARCALPGPLHGVCAFLGDMSYPLYILHVPLMLPYHNLLAANFVRTHAAAQPWLVVLNLVVLVPLCWWIGHRLDIPLRRRLTAAYKGFLQTHPLPQTSLKRPA